MGEITVNRADCNISFLKTFWANKKLSVSLKISSPSISVASSNLTLATKLGRFASKRCNLISSRQTHSYPDGRPLTLGQVCPRSDRAHIRCNWHILGQRRRIMLAQAISCASQLLHFWLCWPLCLIGSKRLEIVSFVTYDLKPVCPRHLTKDRNCTSPDHWPILLLGWEC